MTDESLFVDVYSLTTKQKQRVPREWLDDPVLGRDFAKTPSQRELDGELPARPAGDAKGPEIAEFADAAGIDLAGIKANADKLVAIEEAMASGPVQVGAVEAETPGPIDDPLAPEKVANVDPPPPAPSDSGEPDADDSASSSADESTTSTDDTGSSDDTPAAGDEEN